MIIEDYLEESQRDLDAGIFDGDYELFESIGELQSSLAECEKERKINANQVVAKNKIIDELVKENKALKAILGDERSCEHCIHTDTQYREDEWKEFCKGCCSDNNNWEFKKAKVE